MVMVSACVPYTGLCAGSVSDTFGALARSDESAGFLSSASLVRMFREIGTEGCHMFYGLAAFGATIALWKYRLTSGEHHLVAAEILSRWLPHWNRACSRIMRDFIVLLFPFQSRIALQRRGVREQDRLPACTSLAPSTFFGLSSMNSVAAGSRSKDLNMMVVDGTVRLDEASSPGWSHRAAASKETPALERVGSEVGQR